MENNKRFLTIIVILSVLLVGSLGYITYDMLSNKKDNTNEVKNDTKKYNNDNKNNTQIKLETAYTNKSTIKLDNVREEIKKLKLSQGKDSITIDIEVPRITGNTKVIKELNKKILQDALKSNYDTYGTNTTCDIKTYYNYFIKNDVIFIDVVNDLERYAFISEDGGAQSDYAYRYNYFYDIKNDKELTLLEAMKKIGLSEEEFYKEVRNSKTVTVTGLSNEELLKMLDTHGCGNGLWIKDDNSYEFAITYGCN